MIGTPPFPVTIVRCVAYGEDDPPPILLASTLSSGQDTTVSLLRRPRPIRFTGSDSYSHVVAFKVTLFSPV